MVQKSACVMGDSNKSVNTHVFPLKVIFSVFTAYFLTGARFVDVGGYYGCGRERHIRRCGLS